MLSRKLAGAVLLLSFLLLTSLVASPGAAAPAGPVVAGTVVAPGATSAEVRVELRPALAAYDRDLLLLAGETAAEPVDADRATGTGAFRVTAPAPGMWRLVARAAGHLPLRRDVEPLLAPLVLPRVRLPEDPGLDVTVVDPAGTPVAGALVRFEAAGAGAWRMSLGDWLPPAQHAFTDVRGRARLARLPAAGGTVHARAGGWPVAVPVEVPAGAPSVSVPLRAGETRAVEVRFADGAAAPGVVVRDAVSGLPLGLSGEDGRVEVVVPRAPRTEGGAAAGAVPAVELELDAGGGWGARLALDPAPSGEPAARPAVVVLRPPADVGGRVVDSASGEGVPGAFVWPEGLAAAAVRSAEDGSFRVFAPAAGGGGVVLAAAAGYRPARQRTGARGGLELVLDPTPALRGRVVDAADRPVADARVRVKVQGEHDLDWPIAEELPGAVSGADGRFALSGVSAHETYDLRVEAVGFAPLEVALRPPAEEVLRLSRGGGVHGILTGAYGRPLAGVAVRLFPAADTGAGRLTLIDGERVSDFETRTDADGAFRLDAVPAGTYDLGTGAAPGHAPLERPGLEVRRGETSDLGRVALETATVIRGRVADEAGEPVAGAQVSIDPASRYASGRFQSTYSRSSRPRTEADAAARSDEEGAFELTGPAAGDTVDLVVFHPHYRPSTAEEVAGDGEPLEIVLSSGIRVAGRVVGPGAAPVAGAAVRVLIESDVETSGGRWRHAFTHTTFADAAGGFELAGLAPGTYTIEAQAPGLAGEALDPVRVADGEELGPLEIVLDAAAAAVEGTVRSPAGEPAPRVRVEAVGGHGTTAAVSDAAGHYRIDSLQPGPVVLRAATPEADAEVETVLRGELETVDLQLRAVPALAGTVVDAAGAPIPDAEVTASWRGEDGGGGRERLVAGPAGDFRLRDPRPGDYHLEAVAGGAAGAALRGDLEVTVGARPPHDLVVELAPAAEVRGRIVGTALEDVRRLHVVASPAGAGTERGAWADGEGAFRIPGLRPGDWTLTVHAGSGPRLRREVGIGEPGEVVEVELDLGAGDATSRVAGRVTVGGRPLAAGGVRLEPDGGGTVRHATTRYDGSFRVAGLEAGRYRVAVTGDFAAPAAVRVFDLEGEESLYLDLTAAAVEGRVVSAEGLPVAGARVSLGPPGSRSRLFVVETDAAGAFRVPAALAGEYELRAMAPSGAAAGRPLTVGALDAGGLELVVE